MRSWKCIFRRGVTDANGAKTFAGRVKKRKSHVTQRRTRSQVSNSPLGIAFSRILYLKHTNVYAFDSPKNVRSAVRFREEARPSLPRMKAWGNEEYRVVSF